MAGLYLHIPFCKQACYYCNFHFSTSLGLKPPMVKAIEKELSLQKGYLADEKVETIYFGGGTPSLLEEGELSGLLGTIDTYFDVVEHPEITLEANPDDLSYEKLRMLRSSGINRLSIGIQSFCDQNLRYLNRSHTAEEAIKSIALAREAGFSQINTDLIYGIPSRGHTAWEKDIETILKICPSHISAYCLTIEEHTVFGNWLRKGKIKKIDEDFAAAQFQIGIAHLQEGGYEQYEISNFCLPGHYARHNSNYWKEEKYLGVGPGAHSYNKKSRQYNVANNTQYIKALKDGNVPAETEVLGLKEQINDYILTSLRTKWGCSLDKLKNKYHLDLQKENAAFICDIVDKKLAFIENNTLYLSDAGKLLADEIISTLFVV